MRLENFGLVRNDVALAMQHDRVEALRAGAGEETLVLLEHPPVLTLGRNAPAEHILAAPQLLDVLGVTVHRVERGGDVTYHGPGQLVGYPILDLHHYRLDVGWYVRALEDVLIATLRHYNLDARRAGVNAEGGRDPKLVGVWVDNPTSDPTERRIRPEAKIAQIGVRVTGWITFHGFALNVEPQMEHFALIVPCGIPDKPVTSLTHALGRSIPMEEVRVQVARAFETVFDARLESASLPI